MKLPSKLTAQDVGVSVVLRSFRIYGGRDGGRRQGEPPPDILLREKDGSVEGHSRPTSRPVGFCDRGVVHGPPGAQECDHLLDPKTGSVFGMIPFVGINVYGDRGKQEKHRP